MAVNNNTLHGISTKFEYEAHTERGYRLPSPGPVFDSRFLQLPRDGERLARIAFVAIANVTHPVLAPVATEEETAAGWNERPRIAALSTVSGKRTLGARSWCYTMPRALVCRGAAGVGQRAHRPRAAPPDRRGELELQRLCVAMVRWVNHACATLFMEYAETSCLIQGDVR
jgi:hypothetical protein